MKIISCKALLLGATLALAGNSTLVAKNWFDAGVYGAVACASGALAQQSYCYSKTNPSNVIDSQNAFTYSLICVTSILLAANALRTKPEQSKLTPCRSN